MATDLVNVLSDRVSETISSIAESQSKEMIDRLIEDIESKIDSDDRRADSPRGAGEETNIEPTKNHVIGSIRRAEINGHDDARVAVFPTKESELPFLKENNVWGFIRVGSEFEYVAMYVTGNVREVKYFPTVRNVVPPDEAKLVRPPKEYADGAQIADDKLVVRFKKGSLYELEDSVPYETKYPQSLQYTTLGALRTAGTTDDML